MKTVHSHFSWTKKLGYFIVIEKILLKFFCDINWFYQLKLFTLCVNGPRWHMSSYNIYLDLERYDETKYIHQYLSFSLSSFSSCDIHSHTRAYTCLTPSKMSIVKEYMLRPQTYLIQTVHRIIPQHHMDNIQ